MTRSNRVIALTVLGILSFATLLLGGCAKDDKPTDKGYYTGPMEKKPASQAGSKTSGLVQ